MTKDTALMRDIIEYARKKLTKEYGGCHASILPDKFAEACSFKEGGQRITVAINIVPDSTGNNEIKS